MGERLPNRVSDDRNGRRASASLWRVGQLTNNFIAHPAIWGVVAEAEGRIVGSNFVDERGTIHGVGPITVDPEAQGRGVGRRLMEAVMERSRGSRASASSRTPSTSVPLALCLARLRGQGAGCPDQREAEERSGGRHRGAPARGGRSPAVREPVPHGPRLRAHERAARRYPGPGLLALRRRPRRTHHRLCHDPDLLPGGIRRRRDRGRHARLDPGRCAAVEQPASFLLPTRQAGLFRWCLGEGLRAIKPVTYMAIGEYREPTVLDPVGALLTTRGRCLSARHAGGLASAHRALGTITPERGQGRASRR